MLVMTGMVYVCYYRNLFIACYDWNLFVFVTNNLGGSVLYNFV